MKQTEKIFQNIVNGKKYTDKELALFALGMTEEEVADVIESDKRIDKGEKLFELPEELDAQLADYVVTESMLKNGNRLMDMHLPVSTLVIMVKRGEEYIVPNGQLELMVGDVLLFVSKEELAF